MPLLSLLQAIMRMSHARGSCQKPIRRGCAEALLDVAPEAELGEIMEDGKVYVVLDADLAEDYWEGNRNFKLNFTLELTIK